MKGQPACTRAMKNFPMNVERCVPDDNNNGKNSNNNNADNKAFYPWNKCNLRTEKLMHSLLVRGKISAKSALG